MEGFDILQKYLYIDAGNKCVHMHTTCMSPWLRLEHGHNRSPSRQPEVTTHVRRRFACDTVFQKTMVLKLLLWIFVAVSCWAFPHLQHNVEKVCHEFSFAQKNGRDIQEPVLFCMRHNCIGFTAVLRDRSVSPRPVSVWACLAWMMEPMRTHTLSQRIRNI